LNLKLTKIFGRWQRLSGLESNFDSKHLF
jgi:hypothetical protein